MNENNNVNEISMFKFFHRQRFLLVDFEEFRSSNDFTKSLLIPTYSLIDHDHSI